MSRAHRRVRAWVPTLLALVTGLLLGAVALFLFQRSRAGFDYQQQWPHFSDGSVARLQLAAAIVALFGCLTMLVIAIACVWHRRDGSAIS